MEKLKFSKELMNIFLTMKDNKISKTLISIVNTESVIKHNYIDIGKTKDFLTFTPVDKANEIISKGNQLYVVENDNRRLIINSDKNINIFERLGFDNTSPLAYNVSNGEYGYILAEAKSNISDNVYILFKNEGTGKLGVINKEGVYKVYNENTVKSSIWYDSNYTPIDVNFNRNNIKIGKLIRILLSSQISVSDSELEEFVNLYKSTYDIVSNVMSRFDVVSGDDIKKWYKNENYYDNESSGTLNNSCMSKSPDDYFNIYSNNSNVKMLILYADGGEIIDGVYKSDKIKGRAILWDCLLDDVPGKFMDRIYTRYDSDVKLFKNWAEENDYWVKEDQNTHTGCNLIKGGKKIKPIIVVKLENAKLDYYPYMDTLCYVNIDNNTCSNSTRTIRTTRNTNGRWENYYEEVGQYEEEESEPEPFPGLEEISEVEMPNDPLIQVGRRLRTRSYGVNYHTYGHIYQEDNDILTDGGREINQAEENISDSEQFGNGNDVLTDVLQRYISVDMGVSEPMNDGNVVQNQNEEEDNLSDELLSF